MRYDRKSILGFSLIEIMVGMVIGLLGMLIVMQVFTASEGRKRNTMSGDDAQTNGAIALFSLRREIQHAGYGLSSPELLGCNLQVRAGLTINNIAPITINHPSIPAGDTNTDTLLVMYGNSNGDSEGDLITATPVINPPTSLYSVQTAPSFIVEDYVITQFASRATPCNLIVDKVNARDLVSSKITVNTGVAGTMNGTVFNLGQAPKFMAIAIRNGNLTMCKLIDINTSVIPHVDNGNDCTDASNTSNTSIWIPIANNIVSLRAQYGRDFNVSATDNNKDIEIYDQTVQSPTSATPVTVQCGWSKVLAVRLALVARGTEKQASTVTSSSPSWAGSTENPAGTGSAITPINLTSLTDWQNYYYKTLQTTIPIKNIAWQPASSGC